MSDFQDRPRFKGKGLIIAIPVSLILWGLIIAFCVAISNLIA